LIFLKKQEKQTKKLKKIAQNRKYSIKKTCLLFFNIYLCKSNFMQTKAKLTKKTIFVFKNWIINKM